MAPIKLNRTGTPEWTHRALARAACAGALAVVAASGGCRKGLNNELAVRNGASEWSPATIRDPMIEPPAVRADGTREEYPETDPSLFSLERENWPVQRVSILSAPPAHQPIYHRDVFDNTTIDRSRGRYPTLESAAQRNNREGGLAQVREAVFAPFFAAGDIVLWPIRASYKRPWFATRGGVQGGRYERGPSGRFIAAPEAVGVAQFPLAEIIHASPDERVVPRGNGAGTSDKSPGDGRRPSPFESPLHPTPQPAPAPQPGAAPAPSSTAPETPTQPAPTQPAPTQPAPTPAEDEGKPASHIGASDPLGPK
ncbi:MAG TPA: hypothetical protein PL072_10700 [Phycisphaerales bacterium]|nr:hypothetical protein [Phycisphaerales bacterium]